MSGVEAVELSLVLAIILAADSMRRLPIGTIVLRRRFFGAWSFADSIELGRGFSLVAPLPLDLPLVLPPDSPRQDKRLPVSSLRGQFDDRSRRGRLRLGLIRVVGMAMATALVFGVPYATWSRGTVGLVAIVLLIGLLSICQVVLSTMALVSAGRRGGIAFRDSLRFLWPFNCVRAGEFVQSHMVSGVPRAVVLAALVTDLQILRRLRPYIYDTLSAASGSHDAEMLVAVYGVDRLRRLIESSPTNPETGSFCPRCGTEYSLDVRTCSDCSTGVIALRSHGATVP